MQRSFVFIIGLCILYGCANMKGGTPNATVETRGGKGPVSRTFRENSEKFAACARDAVTIQTGTVQTLNLVFDVNPDGSVGHTKIEDMSEPDPDLRACVLKTLKRLHFPPPPAAQTKTAKPIVVTYPLVLKPA